MVKIRLQRMGSKKKPQYCIVAADKDRARNGAFLEKLGFFYPKAAKDNLVLNKDAYQAWIAKGAQPSVTVSQLVKTIKE